MPQTEWLKPQTFLSPILEAGSPCQGVGRIGFFQGPSPWLADGRLLLIVSSHYLPSVHVSVLISSAYKDTSCVGSRPTPMTSFYLNYRFKDPVPK